MTFTSQDEHGEVEQDVAGLMVEPAMESNSEYNLKSGNKVNKI